jgi:hypothetical protein
MKQRKDKSGALRDYMEGAKALTVNRRFVNHRQLVR